MRYQVTFSCRALLITSAIVAGWTATQAERGRRRGEALDGILASGGEIEYAGGASTVAVPDFGHALTLRRASALIMGGDTLRIRAFHFGGPMIGDGDLAFVGAFPEIEELTLSGTSATDDGLAVLSRARRLTDLHLVANPRITGASLSRLSGLRCIRRFSLTGAVGCESIGSSLVKWRLLESLNLCACDINDGTMRDLSRLGQLEELKISFTRVSDAGLAELAGLQRLSSLETAYTQISDHGISQLSSMRNLTFLDVQGTSVTARGSESLTNELPELKLIR